ncbi:hypothetical protein AB4Y32_24015 [Paraburkholderia phymatum]|uniref:Uncharacterized protein n=1 Tax=Paraburkholderia phymatum TaxID=148447 RepID=A0ACC6U568_9BURK
MLNNSICSGLAGRLNTDRTELAFLFNLTQLKIGTRTGGAGTPRARKREAGCGYNDQELNVLLLSASLQRQR